jgi:biopolymer transport protein ExbD
MALRIARQSAVASLSLTPLIDVVFQLLIFFLVATRFAEEERELDIQLPSASQAQPLIVRPDDIIINVDQQGRYFVNGGFVSLDDLRTLLSEAYRNNPLQQSIKVRADARCRLGDAAAAIDLCHQVGLQDIHLNWLEAQ